MIDVKVGEVKPPKASNDEQDEPKDKDSLMSYYHDVKNFQRMVDCTYDMMNHFHKKSMDYARVNRLLLVIVLLLLLIDLLPQIAAFFIKLGLLSNLFS